MTIRIWSLGAGLVAILMAGCSIVPGDDGIDVRTLPDGQRVLADTPRMWVDWTESVDREVARETAQQLPSGGGTWNERWMRSIDSLRSGGRENQEKYVAYIIERRRMAGLPELRTLSLNVGGEDQITPR